ncbi:ribosome biogenesis GTPase YlqF [Marinobacterium sediminicola]|uniref:Ribosome biogenesis GTPase A n=1 Tax=Marinobacterium sediminicola TaxID=518898 RepID=A0ABY1RXF6_9GAMM|nr:ribosome biogenesis GTPase YlqF [Marinobacterium sediminicola]ULG67791.1 ribosome biogenesis GTPase YlqF [Marinobacterium sediminicola]SMR71533.1 ribosome biogenesis GTPase A [Marinobacterium sediminicola]
MTRINWFPGHMHKARKEIAQVMDEIDVVIEVLDARLPMSSENPLVDQLRKGKPVLKLLNKQDLADPERTQEWLDFLNAKEGITAMALDTQQKSLIKRIPDICKKMVPARVRQDRPVRAMIMGIPNVGKSTLINALLGRKIAKVGNEPAVTKAQKKYSVHNGMALSDTPGILWPKIEDEDSGYRLAASGAIKDTAIEHEMVAAYAAGFLLHDYPQRLQERYKLKSLPQGQDELLDEIGRKRGCLRPGGVVDRHKASEILLTEMRAGKLGQITFETVEEWERKRIEAELAAAEAAAAEAAAAEAEEQKS